MLTHGNVVLPSSGPILAIAVSAAGTATAIGINIDTAVTFNTVVTNITGAGRRSAELRVRFPYPTCVA
jgi:hypothetical protein